MSHLIEEGIQHGPKGTKFHACFALLFCVHFSATHTYPSSAFRLASREMMEIARVHFIGFSVHALQKTPVVVAPFAHNTPARHGTEVVAQSGRQFQPFPLGPLPAVTKLAPSVCPVDNEVVTLEELLT